jgi:tetratricopeptide (TPR) repeat protein/predicted Ser/Thr protein kinase
MVMRPRTTALFRRRGAPRVPDDDIDSTGQRKVGDGNDPCLGTETLTAVLEGSISASTRARVEQHASRCASCRRLLSSLARSGTPVGKGDHAVIPPAHTIAPGTRFERYIVTGEIATGGMGVVYAAHDPELDRLVAIKRLHGNSSPRLQERLRREAQAMAQLAHPNVVTVYDVGVFDDELFITMEYVDGETLASWLKTPRSPGEILNAFCAAARGLAAAHSARIIHRDFKPENVLIGSDGRVRVGDFGLALPSDARGPRAPSPGPVPSARCPPTELTAPGTLLGTPHYIAPELYGGAEADARSDQFSFCVALFAALYGVLPFDGDDLETLASSVCAGRMRDPVDARRRRIPRRVRAALRRGLARDPSARFVSMDSLLVHLTPRRRRWPWLVGAAIVLGAIAWTAILAPAERPDLRCTGAAAEFATAWNPERRRATAAAFAATRAIYADAASHRVADLLDRYAAGWIQAHTDVCRATRILGEQTEATLDLRMVCLGRRRQSVDALVAALLSADASTVARSLDAVSRLPELSACADLAALRQIVSPPDDAATRGRLAGLTQRLVDAQARSETDAFAAGLAMVKPLAQEAHALGYLPFEAEVLLLKGTIENQLGALADAEETFKSAVWAAEAGRHDEVAANAWAHLVLLVGYSREQFARGREIAPRATAAIARLGGHLGFESYLERALGAIDLREQKLASAITHLERAVTLSERAYGADHLRVAPSLESLAVAQLEQGKVDRAVDLLERTLGIYERAVGPDHPYVAHTLHNLGNAHIAARSYAIAEHELRRALAIRQAALGPNHRDIPETLVALGRALQGTGQFDEALVVDRGAMAIAEKALPPDSIVFGALLFDLGVVLTIVGDPEEAERYLRRSEAIATRAVGPESGLTMGVVIARGNVRMRQARWQDAAALYERAIAILGRDPGTDDDLTIAIANLARARIELHQPRLALTLLEPLSLRLDSLSPNVRVTTELTLARALWDTGTDRKRARELAEQALTDTHVAGVQPGAAAQVDRWVAAHRATAR